MYNIKGTIILYAHQVTNTGGDYDNEGIIFKGFKR